MEHPATRLHVEYALSSVLIVTSALQLTSLVSSMLYLQCLNVSFETRTKFAESETAPSI